MWLCCGFRLEDPAAPVFGSPAVMVPAMDCTGEGVDLAPGRRFSGAEVARHRGARDAWIVMDGEVYDITEFLESHPGGSEVSEVAYRFFFLK